MNYRVCMARSQLKKELDRTLRLLWRPGRGAKGAAKEEPPLPDSEAAPAPSPPHPVPQFVEIKVRTNYDSI